MSAGSPSTPRSSAGEASDPVPVVAPSARAGGVQSVERAFELLEVIAAEGGEISLSDLATRSQLPLPTIHRLLRTLMALGYARQLPSRQYGLGVKLVRLGEQAALQFGAIARPELRRIVSQLGETANLAVLEGDQVVFVAQSPSPHAMRMFMEVGQRNFIHCSGVGKAIASTLPEERVRRIVASAGMPALTDRTITSVDELFAELDHTRARGFAVDEQEMEIGVRCFAVPVPGAPVPMGVSVTGPISRVDPDFGERALPLLRDVASRIGSELSAA